jgi:hypothetical protein
MAVAHLKYSRNLFLNNKYGSLLLLQIKDEECELSN